MISATFGKHHSTATPSRATTWAATLMVALLLLVRIPTASATPIISIDMDPGMTGIQSSLSVALGTNFSIDVVITGDGSLFDTAIFQVGFDGAVLGLTAPIAATPGNPTAGTLAGMSPVLTIDLASGNPVFPGAALTAFPGPPGSSGDIGLISLALPFNPILPGQVVDIFDLTLDTLAVGTSALTIPPGIFGGLAFAGQPVPFDTANGTITVTDPGGGPTIPEPSILMLFGLGLFGLGLSRRRKGTH